MRIAVLSDEEQWEELTKDIKEIELVRVNSFKNEFEADAYIVLNKGIDETHRITKPVILNSVIYTLKQLNASPNVIRINGWKGFLKRNMWEVAGTVNDYALGVFSAMKKQIFVVADEPGLVTARPVAMIINEGYFALEQKVSTKEEIDIAMKLGTNYPMGPFEWAEFIGKRNIYELLNAMSVNDKRYVPSGLLKKEAFE